jgi:hypothetical protein
MKTIEFDQYRLTSVTPILVSVSVRCESNRYRYLFEINNKLDIGIGFGIGWKCNKVSIGSISVDIRNK